MSIGERLKSFRSSVGLSQKEFAQKTDINPSVIQKYEYNINKPTSDILAKLGETFGLNLHWLITGEGEPIFKKKIELPITAEFTDHIAIPLLTNAGAATAGITEDAVREKNYYAFRKSFLRHVAGGLDEECTKWLFLVRIKGDSMAPTLQEDEVALVNANPHTPFRQGAIYLIRDHVDMSTLAKRIYIFDGKITLHSDNSKYPDVVITIDEHNTPERLIIGRIRWSSRLFD